MSFVTPPAAQAQRFPARYAEESSKAVFAVLSAHLSEGIVDEVRTALPEDVRNAWADLTAA